MARVRINGVDVLVEELVLNLLASRLLPYGRVEKKPSVRSLCFPGNAEYLGHCVLSAETF